METIKRIASDLLVAVLSLLAALLAIFVAVLEQFIDFGPVEQTYFNVAIEVSATLEELFRKDKNAS